MNVHEALKFILERMEAGQYYRWDLGYNNIIQWDNKESYE